MPLHNEGESVGGMHSTKAISTTWLGCLRVMLLVYLHDREPMTPLSSPSASENSQIFLYSGSRKIDPKTLKKSDHFSFTLLQFKAIAELFLAVPELTFLQDYWQ